METEFQKKSQKVKLEKIELDNNPKLILSEDILRKISYLCNRINEVEWSGVMFYSTKGSIKDFDTLELIVKDIYLMDKGSAAYTEYETNSELIKYIMDNNLQDFQRAHCHSHNEMKTFFSGTDMSELEDNSEFYNYYLSLIVNNAGNMTAKIAMRGTIESKSESVFTYKNEDGKKIKIKNSDEDNKDILFILDCKIIKLFNIDKKFEDLVENIIKKSDKEKEDFSREMGRNQKQLFSDDVEEYLVELLSDIDEPSDDLRIILKNLNKNYSTKEDIKEWIESTKLGLYSTYIDVYGKQKELLINKQIAILNKYNYPVAKEVIKLLKEYKENTIAKYDDIDAFYHREDNHIPYWNNY